LEFSSDSLGAFTKTDPMDGYSLSTFLFLAAVLFAIFAAGESSC
jgi:hypothetical protein